MLLTAKESDFLKDLKGAEELCIEKYTRYAAAAKCPELKNLFETMKSTEEKHLSAICSMMAGNEPTPPENISAKGDGTVFCGYAYTSPEDKKSDQFLLSDMLSTEKHVSAVYDTGIFEFRSPAARKMLSHIQCDEQQHGEMIYAFMNANSMYN
jgi:rubrerythrin